MIIRYAEEKNFIELRQFYDGMCKVLSGKDFLPEGDKGGFPPDEMIKDAIKERNQFIGIEDGRIVAAYEQTFYCVEIGNHLFLHYMEQTWESEDDITITAPVYIARVNDDETECEELTAMDFLAAMIFLNDHFVAITGEDGKTICGYWLPKEKKED